jgi:hypothetical protein
MKFRSRDYLDLPRFATTWNLLEMSPQDDVDGIEKKTGAYVR